MGKLRLDIDALEVQSFGTGAEEERKGTVRAHSDFNTAQYQCPDASYACTETHYWEGCPSGGYENCPNEQLPGGIHDTRACIGG